MINNILISSEVEKTLEKMAYDKDSLVRVAVAENPKTSTETLDRLARDEDWEVRYCVAKNIHASRKTRFSLVGDEVPEVSESAKYSLSMSWIVLIN